jgi:hypothetical protein
VRRKRAGGVGLTVWCADDEAVVLLVAARKRKPHPISVSLPPLYFAHRLTGFPRSQPQLSRTYRAENPPDSFSRRAIRNQPKKKLSACSSGRQVKSPWGWITRYHDDVIIGPQLPGMGDSLTNTDGQADFLFFLLVRSLKRKSPCRAES